MVASLRAVVDAARRAARDAAGPRPTPSTLETLAWLETSLEGAAAPRGPGFEDLLRAVEECAGAVNPARSRSVAVLLAAAAAMVAEAMPSARTVAATVWVMVHRTYGGMNVFAVTSDGRFLAAYALGERHSRPRLVVDAVSAHGAAVARTRSMEEYGYSLWGVPAPARLLDVGVGSVADLVRAAVGAGWPRPDGWPELPATAPGEA